MPWHESVQPGEGVAQQARSEGSPPRSVIRDPLGRSPDLLQEARCTFVSGAAVPVVAREGEIRVPPRSVHRVQPEANEGAAPKRSPQEAERDRVRAGAQEQGG